MTLQMKMEHSTDPATEIEDAIGNLDVLEVSGAQVLVGTYKRPEKTQGGLYVPETARREDEYQGKVGLVLKVGPLAFKDSSSVEFGGFDVQPGDWVFYKAADGFATGINGVHCRLLEDVHIRGKVIHPDVVY